MNRIILTFMAAFALLFNACTNAQSQSKTALNATEFEAKIKETPTAIILDVRTPGEYQGGHIQNAKNFDWNGNDFDAQVQALDKKAPLFVYCLSGGRSASAAKHLRGSGFTTVYELSGGVMKWNAANLPLTTDAPKNDVPASTGMTKEEFEAKIVSDKLVLVDFYADWCAPCKRMAPSIEEISKEMADKVVVLRINADEHPDLCKALNIDALPTIQIYKNKAITFTNQGFMEKAELLQQLK